MAGYDERARGAQLSRLHGECELNYARLKRLLPDTMAVNEVLDISYSDHRHIDVRLTVSERSRYTELLDITVHAVGRRVNPWPWLTDIQMQVRVYHDAAMAEVVQWCGDRTVPWALCGKSAIQSRDEKWQWNFFLSELLSTTLGRGMIKSSSVHVSEN